MKKTSYFLARGACRRQSLALAGASLGSLLLMFNAVADPSPFGSYLISLTNAPSVRSALSLDKLENVRQVRYLDPTQPADQFAIGGAWVYLGGTASYVLNGPDVAGATIYNAGTGSLNLVNAIQTSLALIPPGASVKFAITNGVFSEVERVGLNGNLASIAALTTTPFGRSILTTKDAASARAWLGIDKEQKLLAPDTQTGLFRVVNLGGHEDTNFPAVPSLVARDNGIVFLARNLNPDRTVTTSYSTATTGTGSAISCGGEGVQFGTVPFQAAGVAVPSWAKTWQMAIDSRDGGVRVLNRLAIGVLFNWISWRSTEVLNVRGRLGADVAEITRESAETTGSSNLRITHETSQPATSAADGLGGTLLFAIRGNGAAGGLNHFDIVALDGVRSGTNDSGALIVRTRNAGIWSEKIRVTPAGLLTFGGLPTRKLPALKPVKETLQVRKADDSDYGALECFTMPLGTSGKSAATTEFVQAEFATRSGVVSTPKTKVITLPSVQAAVYLTAASSTGALTITAGQAGKTYTVVNSDTVPYTLFNSKNLHVRGGQNMVLAPLDACSVHVIDPVAGVYTVW